MGQLDDLRAKWQQGTVISPDDIRLELGQIGIDRTREQYFPLWHGEVFGGIDFARSGLYSKFDVRDPFEGVVIRAVAPKSVVVDINVVVPD